MRLSEVSKKHINAAVLSLVEESQKMIDDLDANLIPILTTELGALCASYENALSSMDPAEAYMNRLERVTKLVVLGIYIGHAIATLESRPIQ